MPSSESERGAAREPTLEEVQQAIDSYERGGVPDAILRLSRWLYRIGGEAEERLKAKCTWEHMSRTAVIIEWGDPRTWGQL